MRTSVRWLVVSAITVALGGWFLAAGPVSKAADDKGVTESILKIADALAGGNEAAAKKAAATLAKDCELGDVMHIFKLRTKKGLGIGSKPGVVKPDIDGIEAMLMAFGEKAPSDKELAGHGNDFAKAAYISAAIALVAHDKCPVEKKTGEQDPKKWKMWCDDMGKSSQELAAAIKAKKAKDVNKLANKAVSSCNSCHTVFRD